jgi:hypothetical protein
MSGIVDEDKGLLAAEFVLGTLDPDERARANELLGRDQPFVESVSLWERRLGELHLMVEPVEPNPEIWNRVRRRVLGEPPPAEVRVEAPPRTEAPEVVPGPAAPNQPPQPHPEPEGETPLPPEHVPVLETAETTPVTTPETVEPMPDPRDDQFAAVEAALALAAHRGEAVTSEAHTPQLPPEPVLPTEPGPAPKRVVVHDLRAERESLTRRDFKQRKYAPRGGGAWRALGPLMTLVAAALAALIAAWRYVPDRLPPGLQPSALLNMTTNAGTTAGKPPRRVTSQFEE